LGVEGGNELAQKWGEKATFLSGFFSKMSDGWIRFMILGQERCCIGVKLGGKSPQESKYNKGRRGKKGRW